MNEKYLKIRINEPNILVDKNYSFPEIAPIIGNKRPFWSVMITTYKRTEYLEQAIRSVLDRGIDEQDMQIEVVDDCSPPENAQKIAKIVREVGKGRITFYRQPKNVGIYSNWNTCINRARGQWVHILSDDDLIMPNFYSAYRQQIEVNKCFMVVGQSVFIDRQERWLGISKSLQDSDGLLDNALKKLSLENPIRTPAIVVAREAYEKVGGFTNSLVYTPDWEMWTRLAANFNIAYVKRPYSQFRCHASSETSKLVLSATSVTDSLAASRIIQSRFSNFEERQEIKRSINKWLSNESCRLSNEFANKGYYHSAWLHAFWVCLLTPSISSLKNITKVFFKILKSLSAKLFVSRKFQY